MHHALLVSILLLWWLPAPVLPDTEDPTGDETDKLVFLVRHAETCSDQGADPHLSADGKARAAELARVLMDVDLEVVYSTPLNRTKETAGPVSESHDLVIQQTALESGFLAKLAESIKSGTEKYILVAGHSNTTPALINLLLGTELEDLSEKDFDRLLVVSLHPDGSGSLAMLRYGAESAEPSACPV